MTLASRVSLFFLGTLGLVLAGFSLILYSAADVYLRRQASERVEGALERLAAAAEFENGRVEWEPHDRPLSLGTRDATAQVCWRVTDGLGQTIDGSTDGHDQQPPWTRIELSSLSPASPAIVDSADGDWRIGSLQIGPLAAAATHPESEPPAVGGPRRGLLIEAALPLAPMRAILRRLAWLTTALSFGLWLLSAAAGRAICRRALSPLNAMAAAARGMRADALSRRLPEPGTADECQDLAVAFNELLWRVEEAFERQRQFTGNASHQLRTPLAAILGQIEVALRRERPADDYRRVLEALQQRAEELRQRVEMLLFLARADGEALLPDLETVAVAPWLRECLDRWSTHARADDFRLELTGDYCHARLHRPLASQLVDNLLENACKHSSPGTPIVVRLSEDGELLRVEIDDEGAGISAADLPHIFEPFYRCQDARLRGLPGAGLGLAVAQRIATATGGKLRVESRLGEGSRFELLLPRYDPLSSNEPRASGPIV